jgi:hypothetical protein
MPFCTPTHFLQAPAHHKTHNSQQSPEMKKAHLHAPFSILSCLRSPQHLPLLLQLSKRAQRRPILWKTAKNSKTPHFHPKTPGITRFDTCQLGRQCKRSPYIVLTKCPRDLSGLHSSSSQKNPFISLQRRHRKFNKNKPYFFNSKSQYHCHHTSSGLFICNTPIIIYNILSQRHLTGMKTLVWLTSAKPYTLSVGFDVERATRASPGKKGAGQA